VDDSKPIFARPSEKALRSRSSGVAGVLELQKWGMDIGGFLFNSATKMMIFQLLLVTCVEKV
jgi:hypothetical protein